jgi:uncharacterized protein
MVDGVACHPPPEDIYVKADLGRVGITPHPSRLCTEVAKRPEIIKWADGRASFGVVPSFVLDEWKIELQKERSW